MGQSVALYGGSFNPIHIGHLITARAILETLRVDRVSLIPCSRPPHKWLHELASASHRMAMIRLAIQNQPGLDVSDVELRQDRLNYPIQSIEVFQQELGLDAELYWVIGCDAARALPTWHRVAEMVESCRIVVAARAGFELPDLSSLRDVISPEQIMELRKGVIATPQVEVSATQIRQRVRERRSIKYLVPESVREYIEDCGLYLPTAGEQRVP